MLTHGIPKVQRVFSGNWHFSDPIGLGPQISLFLASFAEAGCSVLIILGLSTRLATIPLMITMSVAAFIQHGDDPFSRKETALLYLVIFFLLFFFGGGKYSLDNRVVSRLKY